MCELRCGPVLGRRVDCMRSVQCGHVPRECGCDGMRELWSRSVHRFIGRKRVHRLLCRRVSGYDGVVELRNLHLRPVFGRDVSDCMHKLRSGSFRGVRRRDGVSELRDGHLLLCNGVVSVQQLHRRYLLPGVDGGIVVVELLELRGGPVLGCGREHVHELLGRHVLGFAQSWVGVEGGVGLSDVWARIVFRCRCIDLCELHRGRIPDS